MTVITVSTVGFGEVRSLSDGGMLFTAILIVSSIGTFTFAATAVTQFFIEGDYRERLRAKRIQRIMNEMNNHVIICGHGRVGEKAVQELQDHAHEVVIIESNEELVKKLRDAGVRVLSGDATEDENLVNAGLDARAHSSPRCRTTHKTLRGPRCKERRPDLLTISRASNANAVSKLKVAGAQNVIMPDQVGGAHMASLVAIPDVVEFLDHIRIQGADAVNLEEIEVQQLPDRLQSMTLAEIDARNRIGVNVIGLRKASGEMVINPPLDTTLQASMKLCVGNGGPNTAVKRLHRNTKPFALKFRV